MSKVDWSKAPNWCNGYGLIGISKMPVWFDKYHYQYLHDGRKHEFDDECTFKFSDLSEIVTLTKKPQAWSGPEDGLPPVGTVCEVHDLNIWHVVEIKYVSREHIVVQPENFNEWALKLMFCKFRAIKTPEQLAADKRESAIRELMDIAQVDCRVTAARLVDAGFKREGV